MEQLPKRRDLSKGDETQRRLAIMGVGRRGDRRAVRELIARLPFETEMNRRRPPSGASCAS